MPKIVDPQARREAVVEAVFRVVQRDGLARASLRNVADEAGLAIGSVRHYFSGHAELMAFAMRAMSERVTERLLRHVATALGPDPGDLRALLEQMLAELLPLDADRHREAVVWLEFITTARTDPLLRPHARRVRDGLREVITRALARAAKTGLLREGINITVETERLTALLDGLTIDAVLQTDRADPAMMRTILTAHLNSISIA